MRPTVAGKSVPPRHIRAQELKRNKKIQELAKELKEIKKASASRRMPIDRTIH